ncbi:MAG: hypothetical protein V5783_12600 [Pontiella sp.]
MSHSAFAAAILFSVVSIGIAQPLSGKLIQIETGETSASTVLTNGARFTVGTVSFRLEIEPVKPVKLADAQERLNRKGSPIRMVDLPAKEAFNMLTHLSGTAIVCARNVEKEVEVSINTQDNSVMTVIEQVCFQIDAKATFRDGTVWITSIEE